MPYLNLDVDYFDHPKTKRLIGLLGRGAEVLPIRLWAYCGKFHCENGRLTSYSEQEIESLVGWWGKQGECLVALQRVGFIESKSSGWVVSSWLEHQGHIAAFKAKGRAMAEARWRNAASNAASIAEGASQQCLNQPTKPTKPTKEKFAPLLFPEKFSGEKFQTAWKSWEETRRGMKKPKDWTKLFQKQINWLEQYDEATAVWIIQTSDRNGYQGLFEPKTGAPQPTPSASKKPDINDCF